MPMTQRVPEYAYADADATWSYSYVAPAVLAQVRELGGPVLDLGCGNGALVLQLLAEGFDAYGVDSSASGISAASTKAPGRFFRADLQDGELPAPLRGMTFKTVVCTEVIEHLYDPRSLLSLVAKVLDGGGALVLSTPYHGYAKNLLIALLGKYDHHHTVLWDGGHIKFFSRRTLETMLAECGLVPEKFHGVGRLPYLWKSMVVTARSRSRK